MAEIVTPSVIVIGWAIVVSLPGWLIYGVVQLIRKKPMTFKGFYGVVILSGSLATQRLLAMQHRIEQKREESQAIASKTTLFEDLKPGCKESNVTPEECTRRSSCTVTMLEALYPTNATWVRFDHRVFKGEAKAKEVLHETLVACGSKLPR
jgi:hypothetical protein